MSQFKGPLSLDERESNTHLFVIGRIHAKPGHQHVRSEAFGALMKKHSDRQFCGSLCLKKVLMISRCSPSRSFACHRSNEGGGRRARAKAARRGRKCWPNTAKTTSIMSAASSLSTEMADLTSKSLSSLIDSVSSRRRSRLRIDGRSCGVAGVNSSGSF